jgi:hypothetical protein
LALCKTFNISDELIADDASWAAIRDTLLSELCASRISASPKTKQALLNRYPGAQWMVTGIQIINDRERLDKFPGKKPFGYVIDLADVANLSAEPRYIISLIDF